MSRTRRQQVRSRHRDPRQPVGRRRAPVRPLGAWGAAQVRMSGYEWPAVDGPPRADSDKPVGLAQQVVGVEGFLRAVRSRHRRPPAALLPSSRSCRCRSRSRSPRPPRRHGGPPRPLPMRLQRREVRIPLPRCSLSASPSRVEIPRYTSDVLSAPLALSVTWPIALHSSSTVPRHASRSRLPVSCSQQGDPGGSERPVILDQRGCVSELRR